MTDNAFWVNRIIETGAADPQELAKGFNPLNWRGHPESQREALEEALDSIGILQRVLVNRRSGRVIDGHLRIELAVLKGQPLIPVDYVELTDDEEALALATLDAITEQAEPIADKLAALLERTREMTADKPGLAGMLEALRQRAGVNGNGQTPKDAEPQIDKAAQLKEQWGTKLGQVWEMPSQVDGRPHRIVCGDCTDRAVVEAVMRGERAEQMVTDPPYGVEYEPLFRERALGASVRRAQVVRNDDVSSWKNAFELFTGDIAYVWHADRQAIISGLDLEAIGFEITATIIWKKPHSPFGQGHYNYQHEPCWYANRKGKNHQWAGGKDSTVWEIALDETAEGGHGTQKPLECMARPIKNHTAVIVYDPFIGSGTTLIAAHNLHRIARGIEIDPGYVAVTLERYQQAFGIQPRLLTG